MKEYNINKQMVLKKEEGLFNLYLNEEKFDFYSITKINLNLFVRTFTSLPNKYNRDDFSELNISDEDILKGIGSKIQEWVNKNFVENLIPHQLSLPILKKLSILGDKKALKAYHQEKLKLANDLSYVSFLFSKEFLTEEEVHFIVKEIRPLNNIYVIDNLNLTKFPLNICNFENVEHLYLPGNKFDSLPENLINLRNLKELILTENNFIKFPEVLKEIQTLKIIRFTGNKISEIPNWIYRLESLQELYIDHNLISKIPESILNLKSLNLLNLKGNPLPKSDKMVEELKKKGIEIII